MTKKLDTNIDGAELIKAMELVEQKKDPSKAINKLLIGQQKQFLNSLEVSDD